MNEIHIDRLDLKCRGIEAATARAALRELGPALARQLQHGAAPRPRRSESSAVQVPARVRPSALASTVASHITAAIHSRTGAAGHADKT